MRRVRRTAATVVTAGAVAAGLAAYGAGSATKDDERGAVDETGGLQPQGSTTTPDVLNDGGTPAASPDVAGSDTTPDTTPDAAPDSTPDAATAVPGASSDATTSTVVTPPPTPTPQASQTRSTGETPDEVLTPDGVGHVQGTPGPLMPVTTQSGGRSAPVTLAAKAVAPAPMTRAGIIARAQSWVDAGVPYSQSDYRGGYRTDCSGYVSMAWNLGTNAWTGNLTDYAVSISKDDLQSGDILLYHNAANPVHGSHVVIFDRWVDAAHTRYYGYEQTPPNTLHRAIPYSYFNSDKFKPYRYKYLTSGSAGGGVTADGFPGASYFGPGAYNDYVTQLGRMLVAAGYGSYYQQGPSPDWGQADGNATAAFQRAQGWSGPDADGIPGPDTWSALVAASRGAGGTAPGGSDGGTPTPATPPPFPGAQFFGPGQSNDYVTQLGRQLVLKGYGSFYRQGPDPEWGDADRRNVQAFQKAQGWTGADADGIPGPETWRRLFS